MIIRQVPWFQQKYLSPSYPSSYCLLLASTKSCRMMIRTRTVITVVRGTFISRNFIFINERLDFILQNWNRFDKSEKWLSGSNSCWNIVMIKPTVNIVRKSGCHQWSKYNCCSVVLKKILNQVSHMLGYSDVGDFLATLRCWWQNCYVSECFLISISFLM